MDREKIQNLILKGNTRKALEELISMTEGKTKEQATRLLVDYQAVKKMEILGIAPSEEIFKKYNEITMKCLTLVDAMEIPNIANHISDS